jgi:methylglyoxal synthase
MPFSGRGGIKMKKLSLALIADDSKREDIISLTKAHREELAEIDLIATRNTGELFQSKLGLEVTLLEDERLGGALQVGGLVVSDEVRAVIFLLDPLLPVGPEIASLLSVCNLHDVPLATNLTTGEAVIHLMFEHPEALSGHHLAAQYLADMASVHG